jgi:hypothetical protein
LQGIAAVPFSDPKCLAALDAVESRGEVPDGDSPEALLQEGLIVPDRDGRWRLTVKGRLRLANLRSLERQRQKG